MASKYGLLTDIHLGKRKSSLTIYQWQLKAFKKAIKVFKDNDVTDIVILGDTFDNQINNTTFTIDNFIGSILKPLRTEFKNVYILIGNHDMYYKNTRDCNIISSILQDRYVNVHVIDSIRRIEDIVLVPWIVDQNDINMLIDESKQGGIVLGHLEINGFRMTENGKSCDEGLDSSLFKRFQRVISGHFHLKDTIGNIDYLGTMLGLSWGEFHGQHGVHILNGSELEYYPLDIKMYDIIRFENRVYEIEELKQYTDKIVKIVVDSDSDEELYDNLAIKLKEICFSCSKYYLDEKSKLEDTRTDSDVKVKSLDDLMDTYVDKFSPESLDEETLKMLWFKFKNIAEEELDISK